MFNLPPVVIKRALKYSALCGLVSAGGTLGVWLTQHAGLSRPSPDLWIQIGGELVLSTLLAVFVFWLLIRASRVQAELEAAQRKSDARFRHLVDEASELLLTLDAAGQVVYASEALRTLLGRTPAEVQGQLLLSFVTEADRALAERMLAKVFASSRELMRFPLHLKSASGGARFVEILARNLLDHADVSAVLLHCRDITAEHRLVQEKHRNEDRMKQALAAGRLGSFEWNLRTDEIHPDQTFCSLLGLGSERNLIAKEDLLARLREEDRQELLAALATARAKAGAVEAKFSLLNADGRSRTLELHAQFRADPQTAEVTQLFGFVQDITERTEMLQRIGRYAAFPMLDPNPVLEFDAEGKVTLANEATRTVCAECQMVPADLLPANFAQLVAQVAAGQGVRQAHELKRAERMFGITFSATAGVPSFRCYVMDLTEHFRMQQGLAAANRALRMLVDCNQIIERLDSEHELLEQVCRLIVGEGGYRMVWVGYGEQDAEKTVRPIAWAGVEDGYLNLAHITWADSERGQGPTGTAIRTRLPQTCRDIANAPQYAPWRDAALQRGYRSSGVFPLVHENTVFGTLNIYSAEVNHFDAEESALLAELAGDLALGLGLIRSHRAQHVAEQSLAESEFRWRFAIEGYGDGLWDWNVPESTVFFSSHWKAMLGYADDEIGCGLDEWSKRVHPDDQARVMAEVQAHLAGTTPRYDSEHRVRCKDGSWLWIIDRGVVVSRDSAGQPLRAIGTHRDISERKRATALIEASESRYRRLFEAAQDGVFIVNAETGMIEDANPFLIQLLGFSKEEFLGKKLWEVGFFRNLVSNQERFAELQQQGYVRYEKLPLESKDGRRVDVEFVSNVYEVDGRKVIQCNIRDVSDRTRAEAAFATFFELPLAINMICASDGQIRRLNQGWELVLGRNRQAAIGANILDFIHPDDKAATTAELAKLAQGITTFQFENRYQHQNGQFKTLSWSAVILEGLVYALAMDVTERKRAEAALQHSEQKIQALVQSAFDAIVTANGAGNIIGWNQAAAEMFGYAEAEVQGQPMTLLMPERFREAHRAGIQRVGSGGQRRLTAAVEVAGLHKDGREFPIELAISGWQIGANKFYSGIIRNIAGRKTTENQLKLQHAALAAAANAIIITDAKGTIEWVNDAFTQVSGYTYAEAVGQTPRLLKSGQHDFAFYQRLWATLLRGELWRSEMVNRRKDGSLWATEIAITPVKNSHGEITHYVSVNYDLTERRRTEAELRLLRAALEAAANVIVITDAKGTIEWVNDAFTRITGYRREEAIGNNPRVLKSGQHPPEFYQEMWRTISSGQVWHGEIHNQRKDGTPLEEDATITPVKDAAGVITHYIAIKQDITEKKALEKQFLRAQRMESVGMLAGGIAHDLNNVLAPISMGLELLQQVPLPDKFRSVIDSMLTSTQRGAGIVKQVLTFARGTDGERAIVQLRHLIKDIKRMAEETFPRNISLRSDVAADLWPLMADPSQLHQVLLNLSVNARDAMPDGGSILYQAQNLHLDGAAAKLHVGAKPGDYVLLKVTDTGTGMPPEVIDRIFEPFFTTKPQGQGTGSGLPTVLGIIRSHGGFIEVQSVPGKGTTFEVYLPADQSSATVAGPARAEPLRSGHGETILVVDDEPAVLAVTSSMLEANGYRVLVAEDGAAAVAVYAQHAQQISVVVTDIMMPLMDGVALIRSLQRLDPRVRIITVSGLSNQPGQPERHTELQAKGIRHHLNKPFTVEALLTAIHQELHPA